VINLAIFIVGLVSSQKINLFGEVFVGAASCGLVLLFNAKAIRVPPYAIVGGVPAKVIGYRHSEELRRLLIASQWWCWDEPILRKAAELFDEGNPLSIDRFTGFLTENGIDCV